MTDALRGHLDAVLLATLDGRRLHGYGIIETVQARTKGALDFPTGTVYPALHRLENAGLLRSEWTTVAGRQRRTYQLTRAGLAALAAKRAAWCQFTSTIGHVLEPVPRDFPVRLGRDTIAG